VKNWLAADSEKLAGGIYADERESEKSISLAGRGCSDPRFSALIRG